MTVQENGLLITFVNDEGNTVNRNYLFKMSSLVEHCETCLPPFSLIINNDGNIQIYGNGFFNSTSREFDKFIKNERDLALKIQMLNETRISDEDMYPNTIDDLDKVSTPLNFNPEIIKQEPYLWCSQSINSGCRT